MRFLIIVNNINIKITSISTTFPSRHYNFFKRYNKHKDKNEDILNYLLIKHGYKKR